MSARRPPRNGNAASRPTATPSKAKPHRVPDLHALLAGIYDRFHHRPDDRKLNARCRRNFVFHMTDWSKDLGRLGELYQHPERFTKKEADQIVAGFLYHVIPHLRAAGRLLLDYGPEDFFKDLDYTDG